MRYPCPRLLMLALVLSLSLLGWLTEDAMRPARQGLAR